MYSNTQVSVQLTQRLIPPFEKGGLGGIFIFKRTLFL